MSHLVLWTANAIEGLEKAYSFLASKNDEAAVAAIRTIQEKVLLLEQFPNIGRPTVDLEPEERELLIPFGGAGYVLLYEVLEHSINILSIKHQLEAAY